MKNLLYAVILLFGVIACAPQPPSHPLASSGNVIPVSNGGFPPPEHNPKSDEDTTTSEGEFFRQKIDITSPKGQNEKELHVLHTLGEEQLGEGGIVNIIIRQDFGTATKHVRRHRRRAQDADKPKVDSCKGKTEQLDGLKVSCTVVQK